MYFTYSNSEKQSDKYALSSIVYCGHCGDIYRRVHWNNRGYFDK
ncbi:zinc ribbon domain-containing protein [Bacillus tuaregi]